MIQPNDKSFDAGTYNKFTTPPMNKQANPGFKMHLSDNKLNSGYSEEKESRNLGGNTKKSLIELQREKRSSEITQNSGNKTINILTKKDNFILKSGKCKLGRSPKTLEGRGTVDMAHLLNCLEDLEVNVDS